MTTTATTTYADELIARRRADDALLAKPLAERIAALVAMDVLTLRDTFAWAKKAFPLVANEIAPRLEWEVTQSPVRTDATVAREVTADKLLRSINRDGGADDLSLAMTAAHYSREAAKCGVAA